MSDNTAPWVALVWKHCCNTSAYSSELAAMLFGDLPLGEMEGFGLEFLGYQALGCWVHGAAAQTRPPHAGLLFAKSSAQTFLGSTSDSKRQAPHSSCRTILAASASDLEMVQALEVRIPFMGTLCCSSRPCTFNTAYGYIILKLSSGI